MWALRSVRFLLADYIRSIGLLPAVLFYFFYVHFAGECIFSRKNLNLFAYIIFLL